MAAKTKAQIESENKVLKEELESIKKMMDALMKSKEVEAEKPKLQKKDGVFNIVKLDPNTLIYVESLFFGGLTLKGSHNKEIRFESFGQVMPVSYEDLTYACSNNRSFAEGGYFYIHNEDAIKSLYLTEHYKSIISADEIKNVINLSDDEIAILYSRVKKNIQTSIISNVILGIQNNDPKYLDRNKIGFIGTLCKKNLYDVADSLMIYREEN